MDRRKPVYCVLALSLSMAAAFAAGLDRLPRTVVRRLATAPAGDDEPIERIEPRALAARGRQQARECARRLRGLCAARCRRVERRARTASARLLSNASDRLASFARAVDAQPGLPPCSAPPAEKGAAPASPR